MRIEGPFNPGGPDDGGPETPRWIKIAMAAWVIVLVLLLSWIVIR